MLRTFLLVSLFCFIIAAHGETQSPIFKAYPNSKINVLKIWDYGQFDFPTAAETQSENNNTNPILTAYGDLYWQESLIENVSSKKVFENYKQAALEGGFAAIFECQLEACGDAERAANLGASIAVNQSVYNYYHTPYYLLMKKPSNKGQTYVAWFIGGYEDQVGVQQVLLIEEALETGLVKVDLTSLESAGTPTTPIQLSESELEKDNPLLARYPGATVFNHRKTDTESITLYPAPNDNKQTPIQLLGDLTQHFYRVNDVSSLKVFENYQTAIKGAGFEIISSCELSQCGDENSIQDFAGKLSVTGNVYNYYRNPYYLLAKRVAANADNGSDTYIAIFVGAYDSEVGIQQTVLQQKAVETGLVVINANALQQQLDQQGKALIYGIYFDTGKANIKADSNPQLDAIAKLLHTNKSLVLYVVGHTDDTGERGANERLSEDRAQAVVSSLVQNYQIQSHRLIAKGVGPYAPASNNTSDKGKQQNRRVELVKHLQ